MKECKEHPDYEGIDKPKTNCIGCWRVYKERERRVAKLEAYWKTVKRSWWEGL